MGKISNNLITEKALRATRVNEALKNFFKAHGGSSTILYPRTVPEHIAYTSSITSPSEHSPNGYVRVSRRVLKDTPGKGTRAYTTSMFDKETSRYVANALNKATGGKLFRKDRKTAPYDQNLPGHDNLLKKYQNTKKGNDYLIKRNARVYNPNPMKDFGKATILSIPYLTPLMQASLDSFVPNLRDQMNLQYGKDEFVRGTTNVPINSKGTYYINPDTGVTSTDVKIGSNGEEYYRVSPDKSLYKPVYGSGEAIEEDALNSLKDTHISADQLARNNIAKAKVANFNKTADYLNDIISGVIKNIPQDISKLPLPPMSADTTETKSTQPTVGSAVKSSRRAIKPRVVNNTPATPVVNTSEVPTSNVSAPVAAPTLSSVTSQAVRPNGGFDNYRRESVLSALRAAGGISPAEAVQRGIIPWEALNYV